MTILIRRATQQDTPWLVTQLRLFSKFMGTRRPVFDDESFAIEGVTHLVKNQVVFIADDEEAGPIGFIAGASAPHMFNPNIKVLQELFWWVQEEHRGTRAALMLLNRFTEVGKKYADWVLMSVGENSPINDRCLTRRGYMPKENSYLLEVG